MKQVPLPFSRVPKQNTAGYIFCRIPFPFFLPSHLNLKQRNGVVEHLHTNHHGAPPLSSCAAAIPASAGNGVGGNGDGDVATIVAAHYAVHGAPSAAAAATALAAGAATFAPADRRSEAMAMKSGPEICKTEMNRMR